MSMENDDRLDIDHGEAWDIDDMPAQNYSTSLSRRAVEMYGRPQRIVVRTWDDCNNERFSVINLFQIGLIDANGLMDNLLNMEYWIESEKTLASTIIHTIAVKLEAAHKKHTILNRAPLEEDDLQDALMLIIAAFKIGEPERETVTPWIMDMISSRVADLLRNKMRAGRRGLGEDDFDMLSLVDLQGEDEIDNANPTPEEAYELDGMTRLLNKLGTKEKEVMEMLVDGLSHEEIAEELGMSVHTVHTHIDRARIKLAPSRADYYKE